MLMQCKHSFLLGLVYPEDGGKPLVRSIINNAPIDTLQHRKRFSFLSTPLGEAEISNRMRQALSSLSFCTRSEEGLSLNSRKTE
jgi:hypothetical protein